MGRVAGVAAGRIFGALLQTVILVILARLSGIGEFGQFSAGYAAGTVVGGVLNFGLSQWVLRVDFAAASDDLSIARGTASLLGAVASVLTFVVTLALGGFNVVSGLGTAAAAAANLLSDSVSGINQNIFFREAAVARAVVQQIGVRVVPFLAVLVSLFLRIDPFALLWAAYLVSSIAVVAVSGPMAVGRRRSLRLVRSSIHYWRESLWAMLRQLDVVIVSLLLGTASTAAYAASARLASPIHIVTTSVSSIFVPQLSRQTDLDHRRVEANRMLRYGLGYTALILLVSPVAALLGPFLLGAEYEPYAVLFPIAIISSGLNVLGQLLVTAMFANDEAKAVADITRTTTVLGLIAILAFAFTHDLVLVAISTIAIQLILVPALFVRSRRGGYVGAGSRS